MNGIAELPSLGVIRAAGPDAAGFLHGQLSNDVEHLAVGQAHLAAYCSPQGRMLASFVVLRHAHEEFWLVCAADLLAATLRRLSMFVLRAKAKLSDASAELDVLGIAGSEPPAGWPGAAWSGTGVGDGDLVALPAAGATRRWLLVQPRDAARPAAVMALPALTEAQWLWLEVASGVAPVTQAVREQFVPQMLNYESVGGVDFHKGCYPGQEVVARSQFRGTLKRRAYIVHGDAAIVPAAEIYAANDPAQPAGVVAASAPAPEGGWDAIAVLKTAAATESLALGTPQGAALAIKPLPYTLVTDI